MRPYLSLVFGVPGYLDEGLVQLDAVLPKPHTGDKLIDHCIEGFLGSKRYIGSMLATGPVIGLRIWEDYNSLVSCAVQALFQPDGGDMYVPIKPVSEVTDPVLADLLNSDSKTCRETGVHLEREQAYPKVLLGSYWQWVCVLQATRWLSEQLDLGLDISQCRAYLVVRWDT